MVSLLRGSKGPICSMCNRIVTKLIPLYDNDQKHTNTLCCFRCKRAIKLGKEIIKYSRKEGKEKDD